ncbi:MAG: L-threonylcarbamoyladenylate synthase [Microgenomates group bacterium]
MEIINTKTINPQIIKKIINVLKNGGVIIYPTETCYGIGADATNPKAVEKVLNFKGERKGKPILIAVADKKMAEEYVEINEIAENLYQKFLPGPVAVVSKSKGKVAPGIESPTKTLGIRIPNYPLILEIIRQFGKPITSTSANPSGKKPPYSLKDFLKYTSEKRRELIDIFLDGGKLPPNPPSTVVDTTLQEPTVLRQGEISIPDLPGQNFVSNSEEETKNIAKTIFGRLQNLLNSYCLIFALQGELGAGKTQFAKGLGEVLGIKENINSPTFVLIKEYKFKILEHSGTFFHIDTWRIKTEEELLDLGLEKMIKPGNIVAIEWLQKVRDLLEKISKEKKAKVIWITIEILSENKRRIKYKI